MKGSKVFGVSIAMFVSILAANAEPIITTIDVPGSGRLGTSAMGINNAGQIVGTFSDTADGSHGFLYTNGSFATIDFPGTSSGTRVNGINDAGAIVGTSIPRAFLLSNGSFTVLDSPLFPVPPNPVPFGASMVANDINNAGQIIGTYSHGGIAPQPSDGFLVTDGVFTGIFLGTLTQATAINDAGHKLVSGTAPGTGTGILNPDGTFTPLSFPGASLSFLRGINNRNQIAGCYFQSGSGTHGFVYDSGAFLPFDVPGATSTCVGGINDAGQIVGTYTDPGGTSHGFLSETSALTPVPEPASWLLLLCGLAALQISRRRRSDRLPGLIDNP